MTKRMLAGACALMLSLSTIAVAQGPGGQGGGQGGPGGMGGGQGMQQQMQAMMWKDIALTDAQKATLEQLNKDQMAFRETMRGADRQDPAVRQKNQEFMAKREEAIKAMLTPEQQAQYAKNREEMQAQMRARMGGPPPAL
jgi:Spy/CpxP family protein refolding chaperone